MTVWRPALADRYAIHLPVDVGDSTPRFVGTDVATGQPVVVAVATPEWAAIRRQGISLSHRHLSAVLEVVDDYEPRAFPLNGDASPDFGIVVVSELVRGRSLLELLQTGPLVPERAVAWTIRLLEALSLLHQKKVPHGAISAAALVAEPRLRPIAPVLTQALFPPFQSYASFERIAGEGPSIEDDLWATGVLLFEMLTNRHPFESTHRLRNMQELGASDVTILDDFPHGTELGVILRRALSARSRRFSSALEMQAFLESWERRVALPSTPRGKPPVPNRPGPSVGTSSWDKLFDQSAVSLKRLEAVLDAAEQMRQSMLAQSVSQVLAPLPTSKSDETAQPAGKLGQANRGAKSIGSNSGGPISWRRPTSIGPELAAFAARSRPKVKAVLGWMGLVALVSVGALFWGLRDDRSVLVALKAPVVPTEPPKASELPVAHRPRLSAKEEANQCIRSYFREDALRADVELGFVCTDEDFVAVNRRLYEESSSPVTTGAPDAVLDGGAAVSEGPAASASAMKDSTAGTPASGNPALVVRSGGTNQVWLLGWYELVATAIIRQSCCREAAPIKLPETTGWCQQLQSVVRRIASDSGKVGDISPGVRVFDEAIICLMAQGKHVVYPYKAVPTVAHKTAFQQFLKHAAEADAQRASRR